MTGEYTRRLKTGHVVQADDDRRIERFPLGMGHWLFPFLYTLAEGG